MPKSETVILLRNLDHRVATIEQILPTLATKADLKAFPTRDDPKGFATKEDMLEEGERSRRYMKILTEEIKETVNRSLDVQIAHTERLQVHDARLDGHDAAIGAIDARVGTIARRRRRSG